MKGPPPERPDLAIYSQDERFALSATPTWDNPDMLTNQWRPFRLYPEVTVTVRNLSASVTAVNTDVTLFLSQFGIGMPRSLLATQRVTVGPGQRVDLLYPLPQAVMNAADQRIGTRVEINHPKDARTINNIGAQLLADAFSSQEGRNFTVRFPLRNPIAVAQQLTLSALPNNLGAAVAPAARAFAPLEQVSATLEIRIPAAIHGTVANPVREDVTVVGRDQSGAVLGGLTYVVWIDD